jgi:hypothetical protein
MGLEAVYNIFYIILWIAFLCTQPWMLFHDFTLGASTYADDVWLSKLSDDQVRVVIVMKAVLMLFVLLGLLLYKTEWWAVVFPPDCRLDKILWLC